MAEQESDYTIYDIVYRDGGVSIIVHITSMDKDIYVNNSITAFERMTEYEVKRMVGEAVKRYLISEQRATTTTKVASGSHIDNMRSALVGKHTLEGDRETKVNPVKEMKENSASTGNINGGNT